MGALVNAAVFAGLALTIGAVGVRYLVLTRAGLAVSERAPVARDVARAGLWGALAVLVAAPARALAQAMALADAGDPLLPLVRTIVTSTAVGRALMLQAIWAAAAAMAFSSARFGRQRGWSAAAMAALVLAVVPGLTGHAAASERPTIALAAATVHVLGAGLWIGGLWHLWRIAGPASDATLAAVLQAFHRVALAGAALVALSGVNHVLMTIDAPAALVATAWGRVLLGKLALVAAVLALGYRHWRGAEARVAAGSRAALRASIGQEALLALAVMGVTGLLTTLSPE